MNTHHQKFNYSAGAFTLIELLVATTLLVLVILGVGMVFRATGRAMTLSQQSLELQSNARLVMRHFAQDISRVDRDGFLVVRNNTNEGYRRDQISFIASGQHTSRTGNATPKTNPLTGEVVSHAGRVWWGHVMIPADLPINPGGDAKTTSTPANNSAVQLHDKIGGEESEGNTFYLGRHVFLLMPSNSGNANRIDVGASWFPAHGSVLRNGGSVPVRAGGPDGSEVDADVSSSRTSIATVTPSSIMSAVRTGRSGVITIPTCADARNYSAGGYTVGYYGGPVLPCNGTSGTPLTSSLSDYLGVDYWYEGRYLCYRQRAFPSPRDGDDLIQGSNRASSLVLQGCLGFRVDWTNGTTDSSGNLVWYDMSTASATWPPADFLADFNNDTGTPFRPLTDKDGELMRFTGAGIPDNTRWNGRDTWVAREPYTAVFGPHNRNAWPKALRLTLTLTRPNFERVNNNKDIDSPRRTFTQVVWLP